MANSLNLYEKLLNSEPLGFIDPLTDLGEFDKVQMKTCPQLNEQVFRSAL